MNIHGPATGKDLLQLVFQQLIKAGAAGHDNGSYVQVAKGIGYPVHQHLVISRHLGATSAVTTGSLRIATA